MTGDTPRADTLEVYREVALSRGRPTEPCECQACDCDLHTFPGDLGCVWCSNGQHADAGRGWPTADPASIEWPAVLVGAVALLGVGLVVLLATDGTIPRTVGGAACVAAGWFIAAALRGRSA